MFWIACCWAEMDKILLLRDGLWILNKSFGLEASHIALNYTTLYCFDVLLVKNIYSVRKVWNLKCLNTIRNRQKLNFDAAKLLWGTFRLCCFWRPWVDIFLLHSCKCCFQTKKKISPCVFKYLAFDTFNKHFVFDTEVKKISALTPPHLTLNPYEWRHGDEMTIK